MSTNPAIVRPALPRRYRRAGRFVANADVMNVMAAPAGTLHILAGPALSAEARGCAPRATQLPNPQEGDMEKKKGQGSNESLEREDLSLEDLSEPDLDEQSADSVRGGATSRFLSGSGVEGESTDDGHKGQIELES